MAKKKCRVYKKLPQAKLGGKSLPSYGPGGPYNSDNIDSDTLTDFNFAGIADPIAYMQKINTTSSDKGIPRNIDPTSFFTQWNTQPQATGLQYFEESPGNWSKVRTPFKPTQTKPAIQNIEGKYNPQYGEGARPKKRMSFKQVGGNAPWQNQSEEFYQNSQQPIIPQGPISKPAPWNKPAQTQDSQKDPVHIEKTNNFISWLHKSKESSRTEQMLKEDMAKIKSGEYQIGGNIPNFVNVGEDIDKVSRRSDHNETVRKAVAEGMMDAEQPSFEELQTILSKHNTADKPPIRTTAEGTQQTITGYKQEWDPYFKKWTQVPVIQEVSYEEGGEKEPIDFRERSGYESGDYGQKKDINLGYFQAAVANMPGIMESVATTASGLNAMGVFGDGKGKQRKEISEQVDANPPTQPVFSDTERPFVTQEAMPDQGTPVNPQPATPSWYTDSWQQPIDRPDIFKRGGYLPEYQTAGNVSFPGTMPLLEEYDEMAWDNPVNQDMVGQELNNAGITNPERPITEDSYETATDNTIRTGQDNGAFEDPRSKKKNPFAVDPNKSNAEHQNEALGAITTMKGFTGIASYGSNKKKEEKLKRRMSDVYEFMDKAGPDRGDYLANVPGIGTNFRPDETTRMGYNTKIAQEGREVTDQHLDTEIPFKDFSNYASHELDRLRAFQGFDQGPSFTSIMANLGNQEMQAYSDEMKQHKKDLITGAKQRAKKWASDPEYGEERRQSFLDFKEVNNIKQQGGEYNIDDEVELSEAEINNLISQGYNLEYLD